MAKFCVFNNMSLQEKSETTESNADIESPVFAVYECTLSTLPCILSYACLNC